MPGWLSKLFGRSGGAKPAVNGAIRTLMQSAQRSKTDIRLEYPQGLVAATAILAVKDDEMIIAQPLIGGLTYPLTFGESLKISLINRDQNLTGQTRCLGRVKVSGPSGMVFAYRLTLPERLRQEDRRVQPRSEIEPDNAPEAQLYAGRLPQPLVGKLANVSMTGARLHTTLPLASLSIGQEVYLKFVLPEPEGVIDEVVEVQRLEADDASGMNVVCVTFRRRLPRIEALLRLSADRLPMPLAPPQRDRKIA